MVKKWYILAIIFMFLGWALANRANAADWTDYGETQQDDLHWVVIPTRQIDINSPTVILAITAYDWDTVGEASITFNGHLVPGVLPATVPANDKVDRDFTFVIPRDWVTAGAVNPITFVQVTRAGSYIVRNLTMTYTVAPPPVLACRWGWYNRAAPGETWGRLISGCFNNQTLGRSTAFTPVPISPVVALNWLRAILSGTEIQPVEIAVWQKGDDCDAAHLWATDSTVAPAMTRQQIITQTCVP